MRSVLIVDDDAEVTTALARLLRLRGWRVIEERDGLRALRTLEVEQVDAVIADERMAGAAGAFLLETVHRSWPSVRLVMLSGEPSESGRARVEAIGGVVLTKWMSLGEVLEAIGG